MAISLFDQPLTSIQSAFSTFPNAFQNPLKKAASFTYKFTLGCLTSEGYNSGSYVRNKIPYIVVAEGGPLDTLASFSGGSSVYAGTAQGTPNYFINNVDITFITPNHGAGTTGQAGLKFEVFEPHSMGLFFESLLSAANRAGFSNWTLAPFALRVEFVGQDENGRQVLFNKLTRTIPIRFQRIDFSASSNGSTYSVSALEYGIATGGIDQRASAISTIIAYGEDVRAVLTGTNSLQESLNSYQSRLVTTGKQARAHQYEIRIGTAPSVSASWSTLRFTQDGSTGHVVQPTEEEFPPERRQAPDVRFRKFEFPGTMLGGVRITDMIDEIMLNSEYAAENSRETRNGQVQWWRTSLTTETLNTTPDAVTGDLTYKFIFTINPYSVGAGRVSAALENASPPGQLRNSISKTYNYLYSGQNDDIINFDLTFNNTFAVLVSAGAAHLASNGTGSYDEQPVVASQPTPDPNRATSLTSATRNLIAPSTIAFSPWSGGSLVDGTSLNISRQVHDAITGASRGGANQDLIMVDLTIHGDPYFIPQTGMGTYIDPPSGNTFSTQDTDSMAWQNSEVKIYLGFKNIVDVSNEGPYVTPYGDNADSPYSGIYRITKAQSKFSDGIFKQTLFLVREYGDNVLSVLNSRTIGTAARKLFGLSDIGSIAPGANNSSAEAGAAQTNGPQ